MTPLPNLSRRQLAIQILKDPERKPLVQIFAELIELTLVFKVLPRHYFARFLFKRDRTNIRDYFPSKFLYKIKARFNDAGMVGVLENKLFFDFFYRQFNVNLPKVLMYNHGNMFVVNKKPIRINTAHEFRILLEGLFRDNQISDSIFVKRTYGTYGGDKVYKITLAQLTSDVQWVDGYFNEIIKTGYLFQETVRQHPTMNKLNAASVNTLRLDTFIDKDGNIEIITSYLRMSFNNHYVDNIRAGGCYINVDLATGNLTGEGYTSNKVGGIKGFTEHPITHTVFKGFTIPLFEEAKQMVIQVAGYVPNLRLIGWDVAIGESGPVLIEGNSDYDITGTDTGCNGARSNAVFRKVLKEINYL